jgi:hypothetical protein
MRPLLLLTWPSLCHLRPLWTLTGELCSLDQGAYSSGSGNTCLQNAKQLLLTNACGCQIGLQAWCDCVVY